MLKSKSWSGTASSFWIGLLIGVGTLFPAPRVEAQAQRPVIEISAGRAKAFRVALQRFRDLAEPASVTRAADVRAVIGDALEFTGVLLPLDPAAYLGPEDSGPLDNRGRSDCGDWAQSGADALVEGEVRSVAGTLVIEFAVWDTTRCIRLMRQTISRPISEAARLARGVADEIVAAFTGTPGCASTEIALISNRTGQREVYVMEADGRNARAATRSASIKSFPSWLPNADGILYTSYTKDGLAGLYLTSRGRVRAGRLFPSLLPGYSKFRGAFGPRGDYLAIVASSAGVSNIYTVHRSSGGLRQITDSPAIEVGPSWSPTGEQLAFVSDRSGSPQIYTMNRDGSSLKRITFDGYYNTAPAWSPDGKWIAYETRVEGQFDIWLVDPSGSTSVPLITHRRSDESPSWSPDGRKLAFSSTRRGKADIYLVDKNGENLQRLTRDQGDNLSPAWGPFPR
ncbi:MAG: PD40 domain-containing protein [Deltaproteobacteria bacterium]|nr:PD40 domain-containing protein [Deltaproteobacteria bacterium]